MYVYIAPCYSYRYIVHVKCVVPLASQDNGGDVYLVICVHIFSKPFRADIQYVSPMAILVILIIWFVRFIMMFMFVDIRAILMWLWERWNKVESIMMLKLQNNSIIIQHQLTLKHAKCFTSIRLVFTLCKTKTHMIT